MQKQKSAKASKPSQPRGRSKNVQSSNQRPSAALSKGSKGNGMAKAMEKRNPDGSRSIFFEEYVQEINGSVAFSAQSFPVQPGLPTMFAWLSTQAISYQEYSVRRLGFRFESEREATTPGKLMLAFQQDPSDALPASKQEMLENNFKAKCKSWEDCLLTIPDRVFQSEALGRTRFVRSGNLAANLDIKMYDLGQLIVATNGQSNASAIGELYVVYEIILRTPLVSAQGQALTTSAAIASGGTVSDTALFGTAASVTGGLAVAASGNTLTFSRVGRYLIDLRVIGTGLFTAFSPVVATSTATVSLISAGISNAAANAGTTARVALYVIVTERGQTAVIDCDTQATTVTSADARIAAYSA